MNLNTSRCLCFLITLLREYRLCVSSSRCLRRSCESLLFSETAAMSGKTSRLVLDVCISLQPRLTRLNGRRKQALYTAYSLASACNFNVTESGFISYNFSDSLHAPTPSTRPLRASLRALVASQHSAPNWGSFRRTAEEGVGSDSGEG